MTTTSRHNKNHHGRKSPGTATKNPFLTNKNINVVRSALLQHLDFIQLCGEHKTALITVIQEIWEFNNHMAMCLHEKTIIYKKKKKMLAQSGIRTLAGTTVNIHSQLYPSTLVMLFCLQQTLGLLNTHTAKSHA